MSRFFCLLMLLIAVGHPVPDFAAAMTDAGALPVAGLSPVAPGHPLSIVEANLIVRPNRTTATLKCLAEDLDLIQGCTPLEDGFYDSAELADATKDHAKFLADRIQLFDSEGNRLVATVTNVDPIQFPGENDGRIGAGRLMEHAFTVVLDFQHENQPAAITLKQMMVAEGQLLPSELQLLIAQAGSDDAEFMMMKPDEPHTFSFDWDLPGRDMTDEQWAEWMESKREKQRENLLGITSYSSIYTFIYIERFEVRHEILIPVATLSTICDMEDLIADSWLEVDEQDEAMEIISGIFSASNPVTIDGIEVKPNVDRIDFYGVDLRDFAMQSERKRVSVVNGRAGVILSYSTKGMPQNVEVEWDIFSPVIRSVDSVIVMPDKEPGEVKIEKRRLSQTRETNPSESPKNKYFWQADGLPPLPPITDVSSAIPADLLRPAQPKMRLPALSIGLGLLGLLVLLARQFLNYRKTTAWIVAGIGFVAAAFSWPLLGVEIDHPFRERPQFVMPAEEADQVFARLHRNLFRAFDYREQSDVYDALSRSVDGPLLRQLYLDINNSLKVAEQGGARSQVSLVEIEEGKIVEQPVEAESPETGDDKNPQYAYHCKWKLKGTIEHWGHIHQRTTHYDAFFDVELIDDAWKITTMEVIDETAGPVNTDLRKF